MAYNFVDFVLKNSFSPKEPQIELFELACRENIVISLVNAKDKKFICYKIVEHFINNGNINQSILCIVASTSIVPLLASSLDRLTCVNVQPITLLPTKAINTRKSHVLVTTSEIALNLFKKELLHPFHLNLLILYGCHRVTHDRTMQQLVAVCNSANPKLRKLGFAGSVIEAIELPYVVETEFSLVESELGCLVDTTSDIVTVLHYSTQPNECLIEFYENDSSKEASSIIQEVEKEVSAALNFLNDQQFEICEYDGYEYETGCIADPAVEPIKVLTRFLHALHYFGLCGANNAAYLTLRQLEVLKLKTPYERHYLLLCLASSVMVKIRAILCNFLETVEDMDRIYKFTCPKMLKLFEVLRQYKCEDEEAVMLNEGDAFAVTGDVRTGAEFRVGKCDWGRTRKSCNGAVVGLRDRRIEQSLDELRGLILVDDPFYAQIVFYALCDLKNADEEFSFLRIHYTVDLAESAVDCMALERAYRKQELVLKSFRMRECNLLIGTSFLESGIDLPRCNLVVRFDLPKTFHSYAQGKSRARGANSLHCIMTSCSQREQSVNLMGRYHAIQACLLKRGRSVQAACLEDGADEYNCLIQPFCPLQSSDAAYVDLSSAIALVNRYCSKLPSDTFTRLTPIWNIIVVPHSPVDLYICTLRMPINSPIKHTVIGAAMPTIGLARHFAALQTCLALQAGRELDQSLMPITKDTFWLLEDQVLDVEEETTADVRPGTTKRRQYYNKRIAECLTDCRPVAGQPCYLYHISMVLTCPLPDEQNTRGRKIQPPESSPRGFGILTGRPIPAVGEFAIFTRSGEVSIELKLSSEAVILNASQMHKMMTFINFTFTSVLRLQKYLMMFDPDTSENSYFIVPTLRDGGGVASVDWDFLNLIYDTRNHSPCHIPDAQRVGFQFETEKYRDAVVCPWYRNQDQPQYFYVAELCHYLSPKSAFPGIDYATFEDYYLNKYGIQIQNTSQALLDVDHTSARLNFLTPRYVNRKGVALPTTSEEKKRARRENLGQKQILVPELCNIHPFPASLWQKAVCLPCILHRLNALLLANEVRRLVACDLALGDPSDDNTQWQPLDFGWNLADVLDKSRKSANEDKKKNIQAKEESLETKPLVNGVKAMVNGDSAIMNGGSAMVNGDSAKGVSAMVNGVSEESHDEVIPEIGYWDGSMMEVGTWTNDLADQIPGDSTVVRYASPTTWMRTDSDDEMYDSMSDFSLSDSDSDSDVSDVDSGLRIEFKDKDVAEAIESNRKFTSMENLWDEEEIWEIPINNSDQLNFNKKEYEAELRKLCAAIETKGTLFPADSAFTLPQSSVTADDLSFSSDDQQFGTENNKAPQLVPNYKDLAKHLPFAHIVTQSILKYTSLIELKERVPALQEAATNNPTVNESVACNGVQKTATNYTENGQNLENNAAEFSFDSQPELRGHPGPSPSLILQALTMSNANDGINLERLETIGDSFLKYAITNFLYCSYESVHEGKLSHLRSKQVSNLNLYRLGKQKVFAESMVATKFEPHDNWLPPCYFVPRELEQALIEAGLPANHWNRADLPALHSLTKDQVAFLVQERSKQLGQVGDLPRSREVAGDGGPSFIPYNLMTQQSIPDKSVADCVEALIGAYLVACGPRGALLFMSWLGIKVLPREEVFGASREDLLKDRQLGHMQPVKTGDVGARSWSQVRFGELLPPPAPLLRHVADPEGELSRLLTGFEEFEEILGYRFRDKSYLLQAVTHASYSVNQLTDCYQRLEFLGDAVLDYLITRHLFEDPRHHSPGSLTDLRSALVNNTIFASLAVRHSFHKYFRHQCPALHHVLDRFVRIQQDNNHAIIDEFYLLDDDDCEDVEVPKALGDVFESVAGAIFLDSGMKLDAVWQVYYRIMHTEIDAFSTHVPKSPIRELLELEPETAQFGKPEKLADGRRVRVAVEVFGKGTFKGIGRNYRIAKCTAAKCALKQLKKSGMLPKRDT